MPEANHRVLLQAKFEQKRAGGRGRKSFGRLVLYFSLLCEILFAGHSAMNRPLTCWTLTDNASKT